MLYPVGFLLKPSGRDTGWPSLIMHLRSGSETSPRNARKRRSDCAKPEPATIHLKRSSRRPPVMISRCPEVSRAAPGAVPQLASDGLGRQRTAPGSGARRRSSRVWRRDYLFLPASTNSIEARKMTKQAAEPDISPPSTPGIGRRRESRMALWPGAAESVVTVILA